MTVLWAVFGEVGGILEMETETKSEKLEMKAGQLENQPLY
jgi:hypothetical protein